MTDDPRINSAIMKAVLNTRKAEKNSAGILRLAGIKPAEKTQSELSALSFAHQNITDTLKNFTTHSGGNPVDGDGPEMNPTVAEVVAGLASRAHALDDVSVDEKLPPDAEEAPLIEGVEAKSKFNPAKAGPRPIKKVDAIEAVKPERVAKRIQNLISAHIDRLSTTFGTARFQGAVEMLRTDKMISGSDFKEIIRQFSGDRHSSRVDALKSLGVSGELLTTQKPKLQLDREKRVVAWKKLRKAAIAEQKRLEKEGKAKPGSASKPKSGQGAKRDDGSVARLTLKVE